jgi:hypothetical protein
MCRTAVFPGERAIARGTKLDIAIPFEGDPALWRVRAFIFGGGYPDIEVRQGVVVFSISFPDDSVQPEQIRSEIDRHTQSLVEAVGYLKNDTDTHNRSLPDAVRNALDRKRKLAQAAFSASVRCFGAIGISPRLSRVPGLMSSRVPL